MFVALHVALLIVRYEPDGCSSLRRTVCRLEASLERWVGSASEMSMLRQQFQPSSWLCSRKGCAWFIQPWWTVVLGIPKGSRHRLRACTFTCTRAGCVVCQEQTLTLKPSKILSLDNAEPSFPCASSLHKCVILCADLQSGQQHLHEGNTQQAHAAQLRELQAAHEQQVSSIQQAAQQSQADLQAAHAVESRIMQEAHAADMKQLQELREALPQAIAQASSEARHPQDLSTSEIGTLQPTDRPWCSMRQQSGYWSSSDLPRGVLGLQADHMCLWQLADQGG